MTSYKRFENESDDELIFRICSNKETIGTWNEVASVINKLTNQDFGESTYRKKFQSFQKMLSANQSKFADSNAQLEELRLQKRELEKERKKLQTEKLDYSKWLREEARGELIVEEITKSIATLTPLNIPDAIKPAMTNRSYLLVYGDCHLGVEFSLKDIFGNVINEYSPEIFESRMWDMLSQVVEIIEEKNITELNVWDLGDGIDGIIRLTSQLMKLRWGVIESTVKYAEFISNWLNELSRYTRVKFQMVLDSNHSQLRLCGAPKNSFSDENMSKVMMTIIKERLKNNPNIIIIENPTGYAYSLLSTYPVLGVHGEFKGKTPINDLSRALNTPFSYLVSGHIHHSKSEEVGVNCEQLGVRSVIGVDSYGLSLNKTSNAGASLFTFDQLKGLICENKIILN